MYCQKCGREITSPDGVCGYCAGNDVINTEAETVDQSFTAPDGQTYTQTVNPQNGGYQQTNRTYQQPNQAYYQQNQMYNGYQQPYYQGNTQELPPFNHALYLILSILEILCINTICGVIGLIFAEKANTAYLNRDLNGYLNAKKISKIALIIGAVLFALIIVIYAIFFIGVFVYDMHV